MEFRIGIASTNHVIKFLKNKFYGIIPSKNNDIPKKTNFSRGYRQNGSNIYFFSRCF